MADIDPQANTPQATIERHAAEARQSAIPAVAEHLHFEADYWGDCCNTYDEEQKHYVYANCMGLGAWRKGYGFELPITDNPLTGDPRPRRVLDVGGGPVSLLLKCTGFSAATVFDPIEYPPWVTARYAAHGILQIAVPGERLAHASVWDEVWLYNVLQHTEDPKLVLQNCFAALAPGGVFRFFEWINIPPYEGHPHMIRPDTFGEILDGPIAGGYTRVLKLAEHGCYGEAFTGWIIKAAGES